MGTETFKQNATQSMQMNQFTEATTVRDVTKGWATMEATAQGYQSKPVTTKRRGHVMCRFEPLLSSNEVIQKDF
jgi:hypothetical protein